MKKVLHSFFEITDYYACSFAAHSLVVVQVKSPSSSTQVSLTTLREMKVLLECHHPNLINLIEFVVGSR